MFKPPCPTRFALLSLTVITCCCLAVGCSPTKTADKAPAAPAEPEPELVYALPAGGVEELLDFMNEMAGREPSGETDEQRTKDIGDLMTSRIAAADKLLSLPEGEEQYGGLAARTKMESLRVLVMIGQEGADQQFAAFADELAGSENEELQSVGAIARFQQQVDAHMLGDPAADSDLTADYQQLLDQQGATEEVFNAGEEAATMLRQVGKLDESMAMIQLVSSSFAEHPQEQIATAAKKLASDAKILEFQQVFAAYRRGGTADASEIIGSAQELLSDQPEPQLMGIVLQAAQALEYSGEVDAAQQLYDNVRSVAPAEDADPRITSTLEDAEKRLSLLGQRFEVEGTIVGGEPVDWADYQDKVVLVDFWATWCGPCLREVPNIRRNYDQYKDLGFDVVGVNLDDSVATVEQFLASNELPWATVVGSDEEQLGFNNPNAIKCGVKAIPFLMLIGKDGQVEALHTRGPLLDQKLAELLGEPAAEEMLEVTDPSQSEPTESSEPAEEEMAAEDESTEPAS